MLSSRSTGGNRLHNWERYVNAPKHDRDVGWVTRFRVELRESRASTWRREEYKSRMHPSDPRSNHMPTSTLHKVGPPSSVPPSLLRPFRWSPLRALARARTHAHHAHTRIVISLRLRVFMSSEGKQRALGRPWVGRHWRGSGAGGGELEEWTDGG